jgi:sulfur transfer complex TusBCD TusB component (DsrH family)
MNHPAVVVNLPPFLRFTTHELSTDSTTHVLSTLEKEEGLLLLQDDSLHSATDSTTHVLSTLEKEEDLLLLQDV